MADVEFSIGGNSAPLVAELNRLKGIAVDLKKDFGSIGATAGSGLSSGFGAAKSAAAGLASIAAGALVAGIGAATLGAVAFGKALADASASQQAMIQQASAISLAIGVSRDEAKGLSSDLNKALSAQNKGLVSSDLQRGFSSNIFDDVLKSMGNDRAGAVATTSNISTRLAAIGAGQDPGQLQNVLADYLGGASAKSLAGRDVFRDSGINKALFSTAESQGLDFDTLDINARIKLLNEALTKAVPDEQLLEQSKTISGIFNQNFFRLFDPVSGVFSIQRELPAIAGQGKTVFEEFTSTVGLIFGGSGLFQQVSKILGSGNTDYMVIVRDGLFSLNEYLRSLSGILSKVPELDIGSIASGVSFQGIGKSFAGMLNAGVQSVSAWLASLTGGVAEDAGGAAGVFVGNVAREISSFLSNLDYGAILVAIGNGAIAIIEFAAGFVGAASVGIQEAIGSAQQAVLDSILGGLTNLWAIIKDAFNSALSAVTEAVQNKASELTGGVIPAASPSLAATIATPNSAGSRWMGTPGAVEALLGAKSAAGGFFGAVATELQRKPARSKLLVANDSELILNRQQQGLLARSIGGGGKSLTIGGITVNALPGQDAEAIADSVVQKINAAFNFEMSGLLA